MKLLMRILESSQARLLHRLLRDVTQLVVKSGLRQIKRRTKMLVAQLGSLSHFELCHTNS